jgi:two-component system, OmpR family, KDP operon response regulator KdpE
VTRAMHLVLVIDDDAGIRNVLRVLLEACNYRVVEATNAERALNEARSHKPDLLLVDLGLPDGDGIGVIRQVRAWSTVPIVVLSARTMEEQKIAALDAGADDYVTKPFSTPELLARIRAALRRRTAGTADAPRLEFGHCVVDLARRETRNADDEVHLTPLEYRLLDVLASHAGLVVRTPHLLREVWGPGRADDTGSLRVSMRNLRQKLEPDPRQPRYLLTEVGLGYRLRQDADA